LNVHRGVASALAGDVQKCLGAYLRGEPYPQTTFLFKARDCYLRMITVRRLPAE